MRLIRTINRMSACINHIRQNGKSIGFVPTMGYLHEGHLSLMRQAKEENDILVLSIFVNPAQFGPMEDYKRYPKDLNRDIRLAKDSGCDMVFIPDAKEMYPGGYSTYVKVERLSDILCGKTRPIHFRGVATVVTKLFNIIRPDRAYFGTKDYQQAIIIKRMIEDLNMDIKLKILPIVREKDGLAMSSRNIYLSQEERSDAIILYKALRFAKRLIEGGQRDPGVIISAIRKLISHKNRARMDYVSVVDADTLNDIRIIKRRILIAIAVWIGKTRLIDNIVVKC